MPRDLETIVHKAIDRDPAHRYATAGELAADLQRFLDDEPIRARRTSTTERLARWSRHHPGIAGLAAALMLVMTATTVGSLVAYGHMRQLAMEQAELRSLADASAKEADAQRRRAEASFQTALKAVDESFTKISEGPLRDAPGLKPLRLELLRSALTFYEGFLEERADDPSLRTELLATRVRAGARSSATSAVAPNRKRHSGRPWRVTRRRSANGRTTRSSRPGWPRRCIDRAKVKRPRRLSAGLSSCGASWSRPTRTSPSIGRGSPIPIRPRVALCVGRETSTTRPSIWIGRASSFGIGSRRRAAGRPGRPGGARPVVQQPHEPAPADGPGPEGRDDEQAVAWRRRCRGSDPKTFL